MPHTAGSGLRSKGFTLFLLVPQTVPSVFGICFADMRKMIGGPRKHLSFAATKAAFLSKKVDNAQNVCNDGIATQVNSLMVICRSTLLFANNMEKSDFAVTHNIFKTYKQCAQMEITKSHIYVYMAFDGLLLCLYISERSIAMLILFP